MKEKLTLFAKGCIGSCWHGSYHYLEPWAGCGHDCAYCYARSRSAVRKELVRLETPFEVPRPLFEESELASRIKTETGKGGISTLKLSRYTDIFTPAFVSSGLSGEIIKILAGSRVKRIIITTKGVPDKKTLELIKSCPGRFSYNVVAKPEGGAFLEEKVPPPEPRLEAASYLSKAGVLTTVHMDPLLPGFDDAEDAVAAHLKRLEKKGLKRVMFSYLLLNGSTLASIKERAGESFSARLASVYKDIPGRVISGQGETDYSSCRAGLLKKSAEIISKLLSEGGFEFAVCSLKSAAAAGGDKKCLCDGKFYA